ncbi:hypothetical protein B0H19DRAFT_947916, partial [Mycena capillaripes]
YGELPCWRKLFKRVWRKLEKTPITLPANPTRRTRKKYICTCPSLPTSRFLLCKPTVQGLQPGPPVFFLEEAPAHSTISGASHTAAIVERRDASGRSWGCRADDDDDGDLADTDENQLTFLEAMDENIDLITEFAKGLKCQRQFRDQRQVQTLERERAHFLRLVKACLGKERRLRSTRGEAQSTWDRSASSTMFYRARPTRSDEIT